MAVQMKDTISCGEISRQYHLFQNFRAAGAAYRIHAGQQFDHSNIISLPRLK